MAANSVFISHSSKDDAVVRELRQALELRDIRVWADSEELVGGDQLGPRIQDEIEKADAFLAVISFNALNSRWVQREIRYALSLKKPVLPLLRPGIEVGALGLLFPEEPVAIPFDSVINAMPHILAALGLQRPTETLQRATAPPTPLADLVLELDHPSISEIGGARRATAEAKLKYCPADGAREVNGDPFLLTAPLGPIEAEELAWYLERYINWPSGLFDDRARTVVESLPKWGRLLYDAVNVNGSRNALEAWKAATADRRFTVRVDKRLIPDAAPEKQNEASEAATLLLSLPWELLHDDESYLFQGRRPVRVRRSLPNKKQQPALATDPPIRVLLVSPRPEDASAAYIDHRVSARPLVEALSRLGSLAEFRLLEPPTFPALEAELIRAADAKKPYHVVHFDGHGVYDRRHGLGMLCFEDPADLTKLEKRRSQLIGADEIARIVRQHRIPLFFLEACESARTDTDPGTSVAGRLLESGVASVAAMSHSVLVETARIFIADFYKELLTGKRVGQAMLAGQRALKAETFRGKSFTGEVRLHDWFVPVLFQEEQDPQLIFEVPAKQVEEAIAAQQEAAHGDLPDPPEHQFLGRSRDLLRAERWLERERYLVVLGSGGEGKTTFAAELARWLLATCRVERVAFTCVETISEARQVLHSLGNQLVGKDFDARVGTDDALGLQFVERTLREHRTVVVIDNVESILALPVLGEILDLCGKLGKAGETRLVFTSREALPAPFDGARHTIQIRRLDRDTAIRLLGNALSRPPESDESEQDLQDLVDAVGGHARSLVLIAREVGLAGVRRATQNLLPVLRAIETKYPGQRENSLLASAELSLRRLPDWIRERIRGLSVFQGGGGRPAIGMALSLEPDQLNAIEDALLGVGLAEYVEPGYLRFDPALVGGELSEEQRAAATSAWADAMRAELGSLYEARENDANFAYNLARLELPNFLAALEFLAAHEPPEKVMGVAALLEDVAASFSATALSRVVEIRNEAAGRIGAWSHAQYLAASADVNRLLDQGRLAEAVRAAQALHAKCESAGDDAYEGAPYDGAMAESALGRVLRMLGNPVAAAGHLDRAYVRFEALNQPRMADVVLTDKADCLRDLGKYQEAAEIHQRIIARAQDRNDARMIAVGKGQLATICQLQNNLAEALRLHCESRALFESINEPRMVAIGWHQTGIAYQLAQQFERAEESYRKSLDIRVQCDDRPGQMSSLGQLGSLYTMMQRNEDAVRLYRQAVEVAVNLGDPRSKGLYHSNAAIPLIQLARYDEARKELERAVECKRPFGHVAELWKTFGAIFYLETATGNREAALAARQQAIDAYLAYRRDGGAAQIDTAPLASMGAPEDPNTDFLVAAELILILERTGSGNNQPAPAPKDSLAKKS